MNRLYEKEDWKKKYIQELMEKKRGQQAPQGGTGGPEAVMVRAVTRWGDKQAQVIDGAWGRDWEPDTSST